MKLRLRNKWSTMHDFAVLLSKLSTAKIRKVGCVIHSPDARHVLGTGYNGQAAGVDHSKSGDNTATPSGDLHAEVNALLALGPMLSGPSHSLVMQVTAAPCIVCAGYILNSGLVGAVIYSTFQAKKTGLDAVLDGVDLLLSKGVVIGERAEFGADIEWNKLNPWGASDVVRQWADR